MLRSSGVFPNAIMGYDERGSGGYRYRCRVVKETSRAAGLRLAIWGLPFFSHSTYRTVLVESYISLTSGQHAALLYVRVLTVYAS